MKSLPFEGTIKIAEHQEEYETVHAHLGRDTTHSQIPIITVCFELSEEEKKVILETGKIWYQQCSLQMRPMSLSVIKPELKDR
jgi:hypothetical protein